MDRLDRLNDLLREHDCVMSIGIAFDDFKYDFSLTLSADESGLDAVTLSFHDVSALDLNGFGGGLTQFMHLEAYRLSDGLDRIRYEIRDLSGGKISFKFFNFSGSNIQR
ncbi:MULTISPECIES: hypothetical protein [Pseudomonas]|uniref:hypothetical protein n=1 Tax=Pseudomonas TaxID=286 RepID=UPI00073BBE71|nr:MULTISPECIES: hypothetical protein [Pseudomonas]KTC30034.1 hypothetical protein AO260_22620 [Pseudomonas sp. ABAC21]MBN1080309.1 hypothetical protein [Pseudomonas sp. 1079]GLH47683.1 hypothetical protein RS3R2_13640 [Pseudomonas lactis]